MTTVIVMPKLTDALTTAKNTKLGRMAAKADPRPSARHRGEVPVSPETGARSSGGPDVSEGKVSEGKVAEVEVSEEGTHGASVGEFTELLGRLAGGGKIDVKTMRKLVRILKASMKVSRKGVTLSGLGLAEVLLRTAPLIPVRDRDKLELAYGGMNGPALAGQLVRVASRSTATVGAVTGGLASAGEFAPPLWVMLPVEVIAETLLIAAIEMRMVAELHEVYGRSITGDRDQRGAAILEAWARRRGVRIDDLKVGHGLSSAASRGARAEIIRVARRKFMMRAARNVSTIAPLLVGAVAAAELNRRATRDLGDAVVGDLT